MFIACDEGNGVGDKLGAAVESCSAGVEEDGVGSMDGALDPEPEGVESAIVTPGNAIPTPTPGSPSPGRETAGILGSATRRHTPAARFSERGLNQASPWVWGGRRKVLASSLVRD